MLICLFIVMLNISMLSAVVVIVVLLIVVILNFKSGILLSAFMVIVEAPSETKGLAYFFEVTAMKNKIDISVLYYKNITTVNDAYRVINE